MNSKQNICEEKYRSLLNTLVSLKSALVAFSGGVDSSLLLKAAKDSLGENAIAVTVRSATTPKHELDDAIRLAQELDVSHRVIDMSELDLTDFSSNPPNRCYICKAYRFKKLVDMAREHGLGVALDGENADDSLDYRPGTRAARELGIRSPLREVGLTKDEIRFLSRKLNLPTWNKPAYACLATRIPYGQAITKAKLEQVDSAEDFIRGIAPGRQVRVRHHGDLARIEVDTQTISLLAAEENRSTIVKRFRELGFNYISLDLEGYSMGSLNRDLDETERSA